MGPFWDKFCGQVWSWLVSTSLIKWHNFSITRVPRLSFKIFLSWPSFKPDYLKRSLAQNLVETKNGTRCPCFESTQTKFVWNFSWQEKFPGSWTSFLLIWSLFGLKIRKVIVMDLYDHRRRMSDIERNRTNVICDFCFQGEAELQK